jgi:hypothetical protein
MIIVRSNLVWHYGHELVASTDGCIWSDVGELDDLRADSIGSHVQGHLKGLAA